MSDMFAFLDGVSEGFKASREDIVNELKEIRQEIDRKANSGQWSEAVVYGMQKALAIVDKHLQELESNNDLRREETD